MSRRLRGKLLIWTVFMMSFLHNSLKTFKTWKYKLRISNLASVANFKKVLLALIISVLGFYTYWIIYTYSQVEDINYLEIYAFPDLNNGDGGTGHGQRSYVVNTGKCNIPDFNPWDKSILKLKERCEPTDEIDPKCHLQDVRKWMFANGSELVVNHTAIHIDGYSWGLLHCCYRVVERVEQSLENYDIFADSVVRYRNNAECMPIRGSTHVDSEFIRVFCTSTSVPLLGDAVYKENFAFAQPDNHALKKIAKWQKSERGTVEDGNVTPPSIVIIGVDTNSRLNSHRRLSKTIGFLRELGAVEMFGYTKVGENTFPNTVGFLTGLSETEMVPVCYKSRSDAQDDCPYIWKEFDRAGYLTGTVEDLAYGAGFNYLKTGFVNKPTDFYFRPFMLNIMRQPREDEWLSRCIGRYYITEIVLNYIMDIMKRGRMDAPVFIHSWLTAMTHNCINSARFLDEPLSNFFRGVGTESILIFMSDHGDRYGKFRETTMGWYEDKLPAMWIYLPPIVKQKFPQWENALRINSRRLTSHLDLFQTFSHILREYNQDKDFVTKYQSKGLTLLEPVPENRTCSEAGIPDGYCPCIEPEVLNVNSVDPKLKNVLSNATRSAIDYLTKILPKECAQPSLKQIVSAKVMRTHGSDAIYVISLVTAPGDFLFEVTIIETKRRGEFIIGSLDDVLRMNKITRKVTCLSNPILERYCYCA